MPHSPGFRALTLLELLVVVAIMAVLMAVLVPSLRTARAAAKQALCLTRHSELLKATQFYLADWKLLPPSLANTEFPWSGWSRIDWLGAGHQGWEAHAAPQAGSYFRYLRNPEVYLCPADASEEVRAAGMLTVRAFSYSMNGRLGLARPGRYTADASRAISDADVPLFFEEEPAQNLSVFPEGCFTGDDRPAPRHAGKSNVGFADGHATARPHPVASTAQTISDLLGLRVAPQTIGAP